MSQQTRQLLCVWPRCADQRYTIRTHQCLWESFLLKFWIIRHVNDARSTAFHCNDLCKCSMRVIKFQKSHRQFFSLCYGFFQQCLSPTRKAATLSFTVFLLPFRPSTTLYQSVRTSTSCSYWAALALLFPALSLPLKFNEIQCYPLAAYAHGNKLRFFVLEILNSIVEANWQHLRLAEPNVNNSSWGYSGTLPCQ